MGEARKLRANSEVEASLELAVERLAALLYRFARRPGPVDPIDEDLARRAMPAARRGIVDIFDPFMVAFLSSPETIAVHFKSMQQRSRRKSVSTAAGRNDLLRDWYREHGSSFANKNVAVDEFVRHHMKQFGWTPANAPKAALRKAIQKVDPQAKVETGRRC